MDLDPSPLTPRTRAALRAATVALTVVGLALVAALVVAPGDELGARLGAPTLIGAGSAPPVEPPPGDAAVLAEAERMRAPSQAWRLTSLFPWPTTFAVVALVVNVLGAVAIYCVERRRPVARPFAGAALLAPVLYVAGGFWLSHGAHHHGFAEDFEDPASAVWTAVPAFVWPGLGALLGAAVASLAALVAIAQGRRRGAPRAGFPLACCTLVLSAWALWAVDGVFLAPPRLRGAPRIARLDLPTALNARWIDRGREPSLDIEVASSDGATRVVLAPWPRGGAENAPPFEGALDEAGWREALAARVALLNRAPLGSAVPGDPADRYEAVDSVVHLACDERVTFGAVRPLLAALQAAHVWKLVFHTERRGPGTAHAGLLRYLVHDVGPPNSPGAAQPATAPQLEVSPGEPGGPARVRWRGTEHAHVYALRAELRDALPDPFEGALVALAVADGVSWAAFVQVLDGLHDVEAFLRFTAPE